MSGTLNIAGKFPNEHILALYQRLKETARQLDSSPEMLLLLAVLKARNLQDLSPAAGRQALYVKVVCNGSQSISETHYGKGGDLPSCLPSYFLLSQPCMSPSN